MELKNIVIYSDMDGTLLTDWSLGPVVPKRNLESITEFVKEGGNFSIASGRQYRDALSFFPQHFCNAPSVQNNGALIYDCIAERVLQKTPLPQKYKEECIAFAQTHRECWLVASNEVEILQIDLGDSRDTMLQDLTRKHIPFSVFLTDEFFKVVYIVSEPSQMPALEKEVAGLPSAGLVNSSLSAPIYLECFDRSTDKGRGVREAVRLAGLEQKTLVCIGDFFNDVSMLQAADIAACPCSAPDAVKDICQIITCNNNEGALADLIERLRRL